jgi:hypothetical protein
MLGLWSCEWPGPYYRCRLNIFAYSLIYDYNSVTAPVLAADSECPDHYQFPICTVDLCFPEALLYIVLQDSASCSLNGLFHSISAG